MSTNASPGSAFYNDDEIRNFIDCWCPIPVRAYIARLAAGAAANSSDIPDGLFLRIEAAISRITHGEGAMRVPADKTDPDLVLAECRDQLAALQRQIASLRPEAAPCKVDVASLDPQLARFYDVNSVAGLLAAMERHIDRLQEAARRNVKPWEDTFPPTLLPKYLRDNGLPPAAEPKVVVVHTASLPAAKGVDLGMARHWINRYAAGIDDEPQMDLIAEAFGAELPSSPASGEHMAASTTEGKA